MNRTDRTGGEIDWPTWAERTDGAVRERTRKFDVALAQAINRIEASLEDRLDVDDWRLSTAAPHRKRDGRPYADANPDDPGAVVRWSKDGEQYAVACDHYTRLRDNVRAIGLYIEEKRKMSNRPVTTGQDEFATARLPSGDEETGIVARPPPHEVLGVGPDAPEGAVRDAYREKIKAAHPDGGGSSEEAELVNWAKEELLG